MMNAASISCLLLLALSAVAHGDYALPVFRRRLVLLIDASAMRVDARARTLLLTGKQQTFPIDLLFLQDRIASQAADLGDFSQAAARLSELENLKEKAPESKVLTEWVQLEKDGRWIVSYLRQFDAERDFRRYFAAPERGDRVKLSWDPAPADAPSFERKLRELTGKSIAEVGAP